jgi:hypothetical protein
LLFGNGEVHGALRDAMRAEAAVEKIGNALKLVPPTLRDGAFDEFNNVVASALELDLANVLELGWRKYEALAEAARRSLDVPGEEQIVSLAEHRITSIHRPNVEIVVDNVEVSEIDLKIELTIELEAAASCPPADSSLYVRAERQSGRRYGARVC